VMVGVAILGHGRRFTVTRRRRRRKYAVDLHRDCKSSRFSRALARCRPATGGV
jgi:hypothetical protein